MAAAIRVLKTAGLGWGGVSRGRGGKGEGGEGRWRVLFSNLEAAGGEGGRGTHRGRRREKQPSGFHSRHPQGWRIIYYPKRNYIRAFG